MRKNIVNVGFILIVLMGLIVCLSAVSAENEDNAVEVLTLSGDGISFDYPSDWEVSRSTSNYSVMSLSKKGSIDSFGIAKVSINVEKKPIEGDFKTFVNSTYKSMEKSTSYEMVSSGDIVIDNREAMEFIYTSLDDSNSQKEHKAVWFEKNGQAYV